MREILISKQYNKKIIALLEDGKLSIDESLKLFSEATEILSKCTKYLDSAEQKISSLIKGE